MTPTPENEARGAAARSIIKWVLAVGLLVTLVGATLANRAGAGMVGSYTVTTSDFVSTELSGSNAGEPSLVVYLVGVACFAIGAVMLGIGVIAVGVRLGREASPPR